MGGAISDPCGRVHLISMMVQAKMKIPPHKKPVFQTEFIAPSEIRVADINPIAGKRPEKPMLRPVERLNVNPIGSRVNRIIEPSRPATV